MISMHRLAFAAVLIVTVLAGPRLARTGSPTVLAGWPDHVTHSAALTSASLPCDVEAADFLPLPDVERTIAMAHRYLETTQVWTWLRQALDGLHRLVRDVADFVGMNGAWRNPASRRS
jgi:hypothetical protein